MEIVEQYFNEKSVIYEKAFQVEGRELWVPPQTLACMSEVFKHMFYGEYAEKEKEIVPLPEKKYEEVVEFLRCLIPHPVAKRIDDDNVLLNLKLADEYQVKSLMIQCEKHLRKKIKKNPTLDENTFLQMLEWASLYNLDGLLREHLIPTASKMSLGVIQGAYGRQIKSNIFMAIYDLRLQQGGPALGNIYFSCKNCQRQRGVWAPAASFCSYCGTTVEPHNRATLSVQGAGGKGELKEDILKRQI